jgi:hypothetical protein
MLVIFGLILIPVTAFYAAVRPYKNSIHNIIDTVILLVVILFCFTTSAIALCGVETGSSCYVIDNTMCVLSLAFFPFYALVISVYKTFPKCIIYKSFIKYAFRVCGC